MTISLLNFCVTNESKIFSYVNANQEEKWTHAGRYGCIKKKQKNKKKTTSILNFKHKTGSVIREGIIPLLFNYYYYFLNAAHLPPNTLLI